MVKKKTGISRDFLIHPGETIADVLEDRGISQAELALQTGVSAAYVSNVIHGKKDISAQFARALEYALGVSKSFWLNLQADYEAELLELTEGETVTDEERYARTHLDGVVAYLKKIGCIENCENTDDSILLLRSALKMSDISNLEKVTSAGNFRLSETAEVDPYVLGAWIRMWQVDGEKRNCETVFETQNVQELISKLKEVMLRRNEEVQKDLREVLGRYGIDFSVMQHLKGAPVYGCVSSKGNGSYQMVVTIRRSFADEFWFSLFHELGHIVNGDVTKGVKYLDDGLLTETEEKADRFAWNALMNPEEYRAFISSQSFSQDSILEFAAAQKIESFMVVRRLRQEKHIAYNAFGENMLRYRWNWKNE